MSSHRKWQVRSSGCTRTPKLKLESWNCAAKSTRGRSRPPAEDVEYKDFVEAVDLLSIIQTKAQPVSCKASHIGSLREWPWLCPLNDQFLGLLITRSMVDDHRRFILSSSCASSWQANYQHHLWSPPSPSGVEAVPLCGSECAQTSDAPQAGRIFRGCPLWASVMRSEQSSAKRQA